MIMIIALLISCGNSMDRNNKISMKDSVLYNDSANADDHKSSADILLSDTIAPFISIDTFKIYAKLKVYVYNIDSIVAQISFYNKDKKSFLLYKPILPSDSLVEETFATLDEKDQHLQYKRPISSRKYFKNPDIIPLIIPELQDTNFLEFKPGEKLDFQINIANHYNFRQTDRKIKSKWILISYYCLFPYMVNGKHLFLPYSDYVVTNISAPVYFIIHSNDDNGNYERVKIRLPR